MRSYLELFYSDDLKPTATSIKKIKDKTDELIDKLRSLISKDNQIDFSKPIYNLIETAGDSNKLSD